MKSPSDWVRQKCKTHNDALALDHLHWLHHLPNPLYFLLSLNVKVKQVHAISRAFQIDAQPWLKKMNSFHLQLKRLKSSVLFFKLEKINHASLWDDVFHLQQLRMFGIFHEISIQIIWQKCWRMGSKSRNGRKWFRQDIGRFCGAWSKVEFSDARLVIGSP